MHYIHSFNSNDLDIHEYFSDEEIKKYYNNIVDLNNKKKFDNKNIVIIILESFSKEYVKHYNDGKQDIHHF